MRNSRVIALVVASLVSTASFARAQAPATGAGSARQEQHGMKGQRVKNERGRGGMLRGIKLSDAEQAKVEAIHARYRTEGRTLRASVRPARADVMAARQTGDTVALKALAVRNAGGRARLKALHDRQVAEIRGALGAENQRLFDANVAQRTARRAEWAKNGGRHGGRKAMRGEHRGHRRGARAGMNG